MGIFAIVIEKISFFLTPSSKNVSRRELILKLIYSFGESHSVHFIFSFQHTRPLNPTLPRLTSHTSRWYTLLALPDENRLVRNDLRGFRPELQPNLETFGPNNVTRFGADGPQKNFNGLAQSRLKTKAPPPPVKPRPSTTAVSDTLQVRMASAAQAAAERARLSNSKF